MKFAGAYIASVALTATVVFSAVFAAPAVAQDSDWTKRVTLSSKGGHILGNPLAKHQITEYMSYTCNHCATFEEQSYIPLKSAYIKSGDVRFEVRNLVLNPIDMTAAMLARCGGRTKFFGNHHALLRQQANWIKKFQASTPAAMKLMSEGTTTERFKKISKATGFYGLMKKRGYSAAKVNACLADKKALNSILGMTQYASKTLKLAGTPSFTLNGEEIKKVHSWASLQRILLGLSK